MASQSSTLIGSIIQDARYIPNSAVVPNSAIRTRNSFRILRSAFRIEDASSNPHHLKQFRRRGAPVEEPEGARLLHLARGVEEARHSCAIERRRQADALDPRSFELADRKRLPLDARHE